MFEYKGSRKNFPAWPKILTINDIDIGAGFKPPETHNDTPSTNNWQIGIVN